ncbi:MAG TPA: hypothetical protein VFI23_11755 [Rhizomicrobium sp.]|nr:hypothetical protein [Rhizomicrobium sp.]
MLGYWSHKTITSASDIHYVAAVGFTFSKGFPERGNLKAEAPLSYIDTGPRCFQKRAMSYHLSVVLKEMGEDIKSPSSQINRFTAAFNQSARL